MTDDGERAGAEDARTGEEQPESTDASSSNEPGLVRLRWLKINRYRNVRPGTELRFDDNFNVVLGMNGSGKTTLLKLLAAVISSDFQLLSEDFDIEYEIEIVGYSLRVVALGAQPSGTASRASSSGTVRPNAASHGGATRKLSVSFPPHGEEPPVRVVMDGHTAILRPEGGEDRAARGGALRPDMRAAMENASAEGLVGLDVGGLSSPSFVAGSLCSSLRRLDESLETFSTLVHGETSGHGLLGTPNLSVFQSGSGWSMEGEGLAGFWLRLHAHLAPGPDGVSWTKEKVKWLEIAGNALNASVEMRVRFERKDARAWHYRGLAFLITRGPDEVIPHDLLSYGQKRLLTSLYYLAVNEYVVIADELVNGLHHSWIKLCLDQIGQRQAFLTSQNPLLLDYLPPRSVEQAAKMYIECRVEKSASGEGEELVWSNMKHEDAEAVMSAYKVGIQSLSEVLESKGLW